MRPHDRHILQQDNFNNLIYGYHNKNLLPSSAANTK